MRSKTGRHGVIALAGFICAGLWGIPAANADTDLCTFGWGRDVHGWLAHRKEAAKIKPVTCGKSARKEAARNGAALKQLLEREGYTITFDPHVQEIEVTGQPSFELIGAMVESKCRRDGVASVLAVCVSLKETEPHNAPGARPQGGAGASGAPVAHEPRSEGQRPAM